MNISLLKVSTPYWPEVYIDDCAYRDERTLTLSTYVRIFRSGQWYVVFCLQFYKANALNNFHLDYKLAWTELMRAVANVQHLYILQEDLSFNPLDSLQISERLRLNEIHRSQRLMRSQVPINYYKPLITP